MSDWWAFAPADLLMFSPGTYNRLFELTNEAVWPAQMLALAAGLAVLMLMLRGPHEGEPKMRGRAVAALLAAVWLAVAWVYFARYATINLAAPYFRWGFVAQAILLTVSGVLLGRLTFERRGSRAHTFGIAMFVFALALQPLIGPLLGRPWAGVEVFGIAPDPTVLATLGVLLAADRFRWELVVIPLMWCAVTGATLWTMAAPEAFVLPLAGLTALLVTGYRRESRTP